MNTNAAIMRRKSGLECGTGVYLTLDTDTDFDSKTNFSIVLFYENTGVNSIGHGNAVPFSMWDGDAVDSGFWILWYGGTTYFYTGQGTNDGGHGPGIGNNQNYSWGLGSTHSGGPTNCLAMTYDASSNTKSVWNINSSLMKKNTSTYSTSNWGEVGANTSIRIGNHWDGSGALSYQCNDNWKIGSVGLWFSTLSEANVFSLANLSGSIADADENIGMVYDVGYSAAGVTQPNHLWMNPYVDNFSNFHTADTGSTGGKVLGSVGSPVVTQSPA
jgi:hypothetical protein